MDVLNMNPHKVSVKLRDSANKVDYVTVASGRRVSLPEGHVVDNNWLATASRIKAFVNSTTQEHIVLGQAPLVAPASKTMQVVATATLPTESVKADVQVNEDSKA